MNPKVFISHASEDKDRFVTEFAIKLRKNGVDAWLDKWEMQIGDSLVDKIFEDGIKKADCFIVILSHNSVNKPWVKEELNASVVKRLSKGTKIIPIILDDCDVPESLISTLWIEIKNLKNYDEAFKKVLSSIFRLNEKPLLGKTPNFVSSATQPINGLTQADNLILKISCEFALAKNDLQVQITPDFLESKVDLSIEEINDCVDILESQFFLKVERMLGGYYFAFITPHAFITYAKAYIDTYEKILEQIIGLIVNEEMTTNIQIQENSQESIVIIDSILLYFESLKLLKLSRMSGGMIYIHHITARLRRMLQ